MRCSSMVLATIAAALVVTDVAQAGCFATVGIKPLPMAVAAGETWTVHATVMQHGMTPMRDAAPTVVVKSEAGVERAFSAVATNEVGRYRAEVVFPSSGTWSVAVHDGFPEPECARMHTFGSYSIGLPESPSGRQANPEPGTDQVAPTAVRAPDTGSSLWPLWLGLSLAGALALAGVSVMRLRRTA